MDSIIDRLALALSSLSSLPTAIYGHSFGALIAFELARRLRLEDKPPIAVIVGARHAPQLPAPQTLIHKLSDDRFCAVVAARYGAAANLLRDPDLRSLALPPLRADFEALETYVYRESPPLDCAFTVLRGLNDHGVTDAGARAWSHVATRATVHDVDAGHFFMDTHRSWVTGRVVETVSEAMGALG